MPNPRPFITLCQASSLDGRISKSSGQGPDFTSKADIQHLFERRAESDLLLIGAGTVRTEETLPLIRNPHLVDLRRQQGKSDHPDAAIVSTSLNLPFDGRYFRLRNRKQKLMLITTQVQPHHQTTLAALNLQAIETGPNLDLKIALQSLYQSGYRQVLAEGGGTLTHALLKADLVDRIYLTLAPTLFGSDAPPLVNGHLTQPSPSFTLHSVRQHGDELFLRYDRPTPG